MGEGAVLNKSQSKYFNTAVRFNKALLSLLDKKPFEFITISEICAEAGVNRSTFYLHYENTCDLLEETIKYVLEDFASYFSVDVQSIETKFADNDLKDLIYISEQYLFPYLTYVKEHQHIFMAAVSQPIAFSTDELDKRLFDNIFSPILERFHYPVSTRKYVMRFYLNGLTAILVEWLKDGCQKSIEEISAIIQLCIFGRE